MFCKTFFSPPNSLILQKSCCGTGRGGGEAIVKRYVLQARAKIEYLDSA